MLILCFLYSNNFTYAHVHDNGLIMTILTYSRKIIIYEKKSLALVFKYKI